MPIAKKTRLVIAALLELARHAQPLPLPLAARPRRGRPIHPAACMGRL